MSDYAAHVFRAQVSLEPGAPVFIDDEHLALQFAVVDRNSISRLGSDWTTAGIYVLMRHLGSEFGYYSDGVAWELYVGQARRLTERLRNHVAGDKTWETAILVRRTTQIGFNTAHINWMESALCATYVPIPFVRLINKTSPTGDDALSPADRRLVEETIERVQMVLALRGVSASPSKPRNIKVLAAVGQQPIASSASVSDLSERKATEVAGGLRRTAVKTLIEAGTIPVGQLLTVAPGTASAADAETIRLWISAEPNRGVATWTPGAQGGPVTWSLDNKSYSPSGLAMKILKQATSKTQALQGTMWLMLPDGRTLAEAAESIATPRSTHQATPSGSWAHLHSLLDLVEPGEWTTYGELAEAVGTAALPLGKHLAKCPDCRNAHRAMTSKGKPSAHFAWADPTDARTCQEVLEGEGLSFDGNGLANAAKKVTSGDFALRAARTKK